jgi:transposase-like protein
MVALEAINAGRETPIKIRQTKDLNNIIEQDYHAIKRRTRPMLGFKNFRCARILLGGIGVARMIAKGQMKDNGARQTFAEQFYSLVHK